MKQKKYALILGMMLLFALSGIVSGAQMSGTELFSVDANEVITIEEPEETVVVYRSPREQTKDACNVVVNDKTITLKRFVPKQVGNARMVFYGLKRDADECVITVQPKEKKPKKDIVVREEKKEFVPAPEVSNPRVTPSVGETFEIDVGLYEDSVFELIPGKKISVDAISFDPEDGVYQPGACKIRVNEQSEWVFRGSEVKFDGVNIKNHEGEDLHLYAGGAGIGSGRTKRCWVHITSEKPFMSNVVPVPKTSKSCDVTDTLYYTQAVNSAYMSSKVYDLGDHLLNIDLVFFSGKKGVQHDDDFASSVGLVSFGNLFRLYEDTSVFKDDWSVIASSGNQEVVVDFNIENKETFSPSATERPRYHDTPVYTEPYLRKVSDSPPQETTYEDRHDESYNAVITLSQIKDYEYVELCINHEYKGRSARKTPEMPREDISCEDQCMGSARTCFEQHARSGVPEEQSDGTEKKVVDVVCREEFDMCIQACHPRPTPKRPVERYKRLDPTRDVETDRGDLFCQGCFDAQSNQCLPEGARVKRGTPTYCGDGQFVSQKDAGASCTQDYECVSNMCVNSMCSGGRLGERLLQR
jgi:hypothetical protein